MSSIAYVLLREEGAAAALPDLPDAAGDPDPRTAAPVSPPSAGSPGLLRTADPSETAGLAPRNGAAPGATYTVRPGDTLASMVAAHHGSGATTASLAEAFVAAGVDPTRFRAGESVEIAGVPGTGLVWFGKRIGEAKRIVFERTPAGTFDSHVIDEKFEEVPRIVSGEVVTSFAAAAVEAEVPPAVVDGLVDLFADRIDFTSAFRPGDTFDVSYTERRDRTGALLGVGAVTEASFRMSGSLLAAIRHDAPGGAPAYVDENGAPLGRHFLRYPVAFTRISSVFTDSRLHPVLGSRRPHLGVDFAAPVGTPVRAVSDGTVIRSGYDKAGGHSVKIRHGDRYVTAYLHLSSRDAAARPGRTVVRGQVIGAVGATGLATGPHLHFALYDRGVYVDPLTHPLPTADASRQGLPRDLLLVRLRHMHERHRTVQVARAEDKKRAA